MPRGMQVINGTEYVYEYDSTWDKGKKYGTHRRNYFGKIVNGEFATNKKYELQLEFEESKKRGPVPVTECKRRFYGATYLFDAIGEKLGMSTDLKKCFSETHKKILFVAYYLTLENRIPLSLLANGAAPTCTLSERNPLHSASELLHSIEENAKLVLPAAMRAPGGTGIFSLRHRLCFVILEVTEVGQVRQQQGPRTSGADQLNPGLRASFVFAGLLPQTSRQHSTSLNLSYFRANRTRPGKSSIKGISR